MDETVAVKVWSSWSPRERATVWPFTWQQLKSTYIHTILILSACDYAKNVSYFILLQLQFQCKTFTCSRVFLQFGIFTFTSVKYVNIYFSTGSFLLLLKWNFNWWLVKDKILWYDDGTFNDHTVEFVFSTAPCYRFQFLFFFFVIDVWYGISTLTQVRFSACLYTTDGL